MPAFPVLPFARIGLPTQFTAHGNVLLDGGGIQESAMDRQDRGEILTPNEGNEAQGLVDLAELLSLLRLRAQRIWRQSTPGE